MDPADVRGPLAQFQATRAVKDDFLKLLKTLNMGLGEDSLAESHIEEAFEVWWPKLEGELKNLPQVSTTHRQQRTERDLLEEILGLVRNQNRLTGLKLTEADQDEVLKGRIQKVLFSTHSVESISTSTNGPNLEVKVNQRNGKPYTVVIVRDTPLEEVEAHTRIQIPSSEPKSTSNQGGVTADK